MKLLSYQKAEAQRDTRRPVYLCALSKALCIAIAILAVEVVNMPYCHVESCTFVLLCFDVMSTCIDLQDGSIARHLCRFVVYGREIRFDFSVHSFRHT